MIGLGFGAPLILVVTGVQLSTPHRLIATATACTTSARAIAGAVFSAINAAVMLDPVGRYLPAYVAKAATATGLPVSSVPAVIASLVDGDALSLSQVPGINPQIIAQAMEAFKQAYADSLRVIFIIAVPFGVVACVACCFLGDLKDTMTSRIDAPINVPESGTAIRKEVESGQ